MAIFTGKGTPTALRSHGNVSRESHEICLSSAQGITARLDALRSVRGKTPESAPIRWCTDVAPSDLGHAWPTPKRCHCVKSRSEGTSTRITSKEPTGDVEQ